MNIDFQEFRQLPPGKLNTFAQSRIFFGHQSVGAGILEGISDNMVHFLGMQLRIVETTNPLIVEESVISHSKIGRNGDPISKCDDFREILNSGIGERVNIALMKFCYIDILANTDVEEIFTYYCKTIEEMEDKYPSVHFLHCAVPLTSIRHDLKAKIRRLLKKDSNLRNNTAREKFNDKLRKKYGRKVFDLAYFESLQVGSNKTLNYLNPRFTDDGGHLNQLGRVYIAKNFLIFILNSL